MTHQMAHPQLETNIYFLPPKRNLFNDGVCLANSLKCQLAILFFVDSPTLSDMKTL